MIVKTPSPWRVLATQTSAAQTPSGLCGKFGNKLFTATVVRARRKNAGIAVPTSNFFNAAMAAVASIRVTELSKQPTEVKARIATTSSRINHRRRLAIRVTGTADFTYQSITTTRCTMLSTIKNNL